MLSQILALKFICTKLVPLHTVLVMYNFIFVEGCFVRDQHGVVKT